MTLEALLQETQSRGEAELKELQDRTRAEIEKLRAETAKEVEEIRARSTRKGEAEAARERARELASAELRAKRVLFEAKELRIRGALEDLRARLASYTRTPEYPKLLSSMVDLATATLGPSIRIRVREEDVPRLPARAQALVDRKAPLSVIGGLVAETPDGARAMNMTFEELLRLREDRLREILSR
jgi:vacuolar-type H+-ATPase subunit E/Vma4